MASIVHTDRTIVRFVATLILSMLAAAPAAARPIIVGAGTPESCTEAALQLALLTAADEHGGRIRFDCGDAPATISFAALLPGEARQARVVVPDKTTIDGDGLITLDGGWRDGDLILVPEGVHAELRGVTVRRGELFGIAVVNRGTLEIAGCTVRDNLGVIVLNYYGDLRVRHSLFTRNGSILSDAPIYNFHGLLTVNHTTFTENSADGGGGGIINDGIATIRNSVFTSNFGHWVGGALINRANADATIDNSQFSANFSYENGGALWNAGKMTVRDSSITGNETDKSGGGLYLAEGSVTKLVNTFVTGNSAKSGGGIYRAPGSSPAKLIATTVSGNLPDDMAPQQ